MKRREDIEPQVSGSPSREQLNIMRQQTDEEPFFMKPRTIMRPPQTLEEEPQFRRPPEVMRQHTDEEPQCTRTHDVFRQKTDEEPYFMRPPQNDDEPHFMKSLAGMMPPSTEEEPHFMKAGRGEELPFMRPQTVGLQAEAKKASSPGLGQALASIGFDLGLDKGKVLMEGRHQKGPAFSKIGLGSKIAQATMSDELFEEEPEPAPSDNDNVDPAVSRDWLDLQPIPEFRSVDPRRTAAASSLIREEEDEEFKFASYSSNLPTEALNAGAAPASKSSGDPPATDLVVQAMREVAALGGGLSGCTTIMIRHIPCKYTQRKLMREINSAGFLGRYDFFYLPMDPRSHSNRGFAFLNIVSEEAAEEFYRMFHGQRLKHFNSDKVIAVMPADLQGFEQNAAHYAASRGLRRKRAQHSKPLFFRPLPPHLVKDDSIEVLLDQPILTDPPSIERPGLDHWPIQLPQHTQHSPIQLPQKEPEPKSLAGTNLMQLCAAVGAAHEPARFNQAGASQRVRQAAGALPAQPSPQLAQPPGPRPAVASSPVAAEVANGPVQKFCAYCGNTRSQVHLFCPYCGAKFQ